MIPQMINKIRKARKKRILVISASGVQGGIQSIYLGVNGTDWEIISHAFMPYPQKVSWLMESLSGNDSQLKISELGWLDYKVSLLLIECAKTALAQTPAALRVPHYVVLNKPLLWRGATGENLQQSYWDIPVGDGQFVSSSLGVPVITDLVRHNIIAGGPGVLPNNPGNQIITSRCNGIVILINIGLTSRITVIDTESSSVLVDSDCGPGSCLLNKVIKEFNTGESFDRDGSFSARGNVDGDCLNRLAQSQWLLKPAPKQAYSDQFDQLLDDPALREMSPSDRASTVTALTAKAIYDFFRREIRSSVAPSAVYISGGGTNNLTLMEYLSTYFDSVPVKSIQELGIPPEMRIPVALGLTVDAFLSGTAVPWETGNNPRIEPLGRWVIPDTSANRISSRL
jgi:anhydro-N-acetylmuramic acid kinase